VLVEISPYSSNSLARIFEIPYQRNDDDKNNDNARDDHAVEILRLDLCAYEDCLSGILRVVINVDDLAFWIVLGINKGLSGDGIGLIARAIDRVLIIDRLLYALIFSRNALFIFKRDIGV